VYAHRGLRALMARAADREELDGLAPA
jgi:hypothetical protein